MRVVYVTDARLPTPRAHGVQIVRTCEAFARIGVDVTLMYSKVRGQDRNFSIADFYGLSEEIETVGVPGLELSRLRSSPAGVTSRGLLGGFRLAWETAAWLRCLRIKADLFIVRNTTQYVAWLLAKSNRPTLVEYHSQPVSLALRAHRSLVDARGMKAIIAVTGDLAHTIEKILEVKEGSVHTLHDGVDVERFRPAKSNEMIGNEIPVLYVGSLMKNRGVHTLIEAARNIPNVEVTIVGGEGVELANARQQAVDSGIHNVTLTGHVPPTEVPDLMRRARVLVLPMSGEDVHTRNHASPLKLFEYMATGSAIVATDLPSVREVVGHGITAHLVSPDDPVALACGIKHVKENAVYARKIGAAARLAVQNYTWERRARAMLVASGLTI